MDTIIIKDLEVFSRHGVFKEENVLGQKFLVSAELTINTRIAGKSDDIDKSVNYADICNFIKQYMEENTFRLIETAAENLAEKILLCHERIFAVSLKIKKPWAPVRIPVDYVGVKIKRSWHTAYISIGSNIGDKKKYLGDAVAALNNDLCCKVKKVSDYIVTKPVGGVEQDDFLNGCIELSTLHEPYELLELIHKIEAQAKRERTVHWGPRTLDMDIVFYDELVMWEDDLIIPHKEAAKRIFVLEPLLQIAPYAMHPVLNKSVLALHDELAGNLK